MACALLKTAIVVAWWGSLEQLEGALAALQEATTVAEQIMTEVEAYEPIPGPTRPAVAAGPAGEDGPVGPEGTAGATGAQRSEGSAGPTGDTGPQGVEGPAGTAGPDGPARPTDAARATGATGATGAQGPIGLTPVIVPCNLTPTVREENTFYVVASTPQPYDLVFDDEEALRLVKIQNGEPGSGNYKVPHSLSLVDETGSGGKKFIRVVSGSGASFESSVLRFLTNLGDGTYTLLARHSGTQPISTQQHGVSILLRYLHGTTSGTDYGYSVGHVRYGSSHRTKVRKIVGGVAILLASGGAVSPAFNHNEWFWVEFHINGVTMNARYWQEGDTRPGSALLTVASDTTYTSAMGHPGMSFLGNSTLNMDIAEFHFVPL